MAVSPGNSRPRKKRAALAGTHVPRLFDHLLASRVVRRCSHCFWARSTVFKFARFDWAPPSTRATKREGAGGGGRGYGAIPRIMRKGSRGGDGGTVVCKRCNTARVPRRKRERDGAGETTTGIKYSQPQPERSLNCDQTRSRIPTAGGPTNRS